MSRGGSAAALRTAVVAPGEIAGVEEQAVGDAAERPIAPDDYCRPGGVVRDASSKQSGRSRKTTGS